MKNPQIKSFLHQCINWSSPLSRVNATICSHNAKLQHPFRKFPGKTPRNWNPIYCITAKWLKAFMLMKSRNEIILIPLTPILWDKIISSMKLKVFLFQWNVCFAGKWYNWKMLKFHFHSCFPHQNWQRPVWFTFYFNALKLFNKVSSLFHCKFS